MAGSREYTYLPLPTTLCDLCAERVGEGRLPSCVHHCQVGIVRFGELSELSKLQESMPRSVVFAPLKAQAPSMGGRRYCLNCGCCRGEVPLTLSFVGSCSFCGAACEVSAAECRVCGAPLPQPPGGDSGKTFQKDR